MKILTVEVNATGNYPVEPTETVGFNLKNIYYIGKEGTLDIYFKGNSFYYTKSFITKEERDNYFDYIGSKLEVIDISSKKNQQAQRG